jgi:hypothetical protein
MTDDEEENKQWENGLKIVNQLRNIFPLFFLRFVSFRVDWCEERRKILSNALLMKRSFFGTARSVKCEWVALDVNALLLFIQISRNIPHVYILSAAAAFMHKCLQTDQQHEMLED